MWPQRVRGGDTRDGRTRGFGPGTHRDERESAARGDRDANRLVELGTSAEAVAGALGAAGERGGRPGGDVDTADAVVPSILRCIMMEWLFCGTISGGAVQPSVQARHAP